MTILKAINIINQKGILLVYPILNKKDPASLWSEFYPRKKMTWDWNEEGNEKVAEMWHLMKKLSSCGEVVYSKWYQNRATFFSKEVFTALLRVAHNKDEQRRDIGLSVPAFKIYSELQNNSPLSTKEIKKLCDLKGRDNEAEYNKAMNMLFQRFLIVAYGEVDDGAFPSLAIGATDLLFEELWRKSRKLSKTNALACIDKYLPPETSFRKHFKKTRLNY